MGRGRNSEHTQEEWEQIWAAQQEQFVCPENIVPATGPNVAGYPGDICLDVNGNTWYRNREKWFILNSNEEKTTPEKHKIHRSILHEGKFLGFVEVGHFLADPKVSLDDVKQFVTRSSELSLKHAQSFRRTEVDKSK